MGSHLLRTVGPSLLGLAVIVTPLRAAEELPLPTGGMLDAVALSARIDQHIAAGWAGTDVQPAPLADDAEFFRRLSLDLTGRIPSITMLKDFLDDTRPDKRRLWVEILMQRSDRDSNLYVNHFATYWRNLFFSQTTNQQAQFLGYQVDGWLRKQVKDNVPYNQMVRDLLTSNEGSSFYQANENKPENIAANTSRLFLGVKLQCAQCHDDRSGGNWTRTQFWEYAAFFSNFDPASGQQPATGPAKIKIPDKNEWVAARFLDGDQPQWQTGANRQAVLAAWLTSARNPFFARAAVNRLWHYFMGTGLTDPVDAMSEENLPSHPELLDELAAQFAGHGFDVKYLIRAITGSQAYQRTSRQTHPGQADPRLFARMAVRGMTPEQIYDSLLEATGGEDRTPINPNAFLDPSITTPRGEFVTRFTNSADKRTETHTSILQALFLMNGKSMTDLLKESKSLQTVQDNELSPLKRNIAELYLVSLSRQPSADELARMLRYVQTDNPSKDRRAALADIFWALLNSSEFILNH